MRKKEKVTEAAIVLAMLLAVKKQSKKNMKRIETALKGLLK